MPAELLRYPAKHELTKEMMEDAHDFVESLLTASPGPRVSASPLPNDPVAAYKADTSLEAPRHASLPARFAPRRQLRIAAHRRDEGPLGPEQAAPDCLLCPRKAGHADRMADSQDRARRSSARTAGTGWNGEKAGLKPDDVIVSYNGRTVKKTSDLRDAISAVKPGAKDVAMVVERPASA